MSIFTEESFRNVGRNKFNLSHSFGFSCNFGKVIPIMCKEVLPGDSWNVAHTSLIRFQPLLAPILQNVDVYNSDWFVPSRILSKHFKDFITGAHNGRVLPEDEVPSPAKINYSTIRTIIGYDKSLVDYFGLPANSGPCVISFMPFMAYLKIITLRFQDENLSPLDFTLLSEWLYEKNGEINSNDLSSTLPGTSRTIGAVLKEFLEAPFTKAFAKDYFTSALPFAQKGGDVMMPNSLDLSNIKLAGNGGGVSSNVIFELTSNPGSVGTAATIGNVAGSNDRRTIGTGGGTTSIKAIDGKIINADGSPVEVDTISIREFRRLNATQKFMERDAMGGSRFKETIYSHFGVKTSDGRIQDPIFLGSSRFPVTIGEVLQNDSTQIGESVRAAGSLAGKATGIGASKPRQFYSEEWGYYLSLMYVCPKASYSQGIDRMWTRNTRYDYAWPEFAHIGEQPILNQELYLTSNTSDNEGTFGYTPRYAEYKTAFDRIAGDFRSSLSFWTMSRLFSGLPRLNYDFIKMDGSSLYRPFAVADTSADHMVVEVVNQVIVKRKLPKYGTPQL